MGNSEHHKLEEFNIPFNVNVAGTWLCMREQIKFMEGQEVLPSKLVWLLSPVSNPLDPPKLNSD
jgi:hypothetical protein